MKDRDRMNNRTNKQQEKERKTKINTKKRPCKKESTDDQNKENKERQ